MVQLQKIQFTSTKRISGFTIIELIITVSIIGLLAMTGGIKFVETLQKNRVKSSAERIKADLELVRQKAIAKSSTLTIKFASASEKYNVIGLSDLDHPGSNYSVDLSAYPYRSEIISVSLGGDNDLLFDRYGQPDSGGVITVQAGGYTETVSIDEDSGKVTIP